MLRRFLLVVLPALACGLSAHAQVPDPEYVVQLIQRARVDASHDAVEVGRSLACLWIQTAPTKVALVSNTSSAAVGAQCRDPISAARSALDRGISWWTLLRQAAHGFVGELTTEHRIGALTPARADDAAWLAQWHMPIRRALTIVEPLVGGTTLSEAAGRL